MDFYDVFQYLYRIFCNNDFEGLIQNKDTPSSY